jgi:hypothetical protein
MAVAMIESWFDQDLKEAVKVRNLRGVVFDADNMGNLIGVRTYSDGLPANLSGSCIGYCILANGSSIPVPGTVIGNTAYIVLPDTAYSVPGPINIILKIASGTSVTTLVAITSTVFGIGSTVADPSQATIDAWSAQISATLAALSSSAVLYSQAQSLTTDQKARARSNIGADASVVLISGDDYKIVVP